MSYSTPLHKPVVRTEGGLVAAKHPLAAQVGAQTLARGGNAVDAAVAAAFAVGVVEPYMSGVGGIALAVYWDGHDAQVFDGQMRLPAALDPARFPMDPTSQGATMFGWPRVLEDRNAVGPEAVGVPTEVAVLAALHATAGTIPWSSLIEPAVRLAADGFDADWLTVLNLVDLRAELPDPEPFADLLPQGCVPRAGLGTASPDRLRQPALATTLAALADSGPDALYRGALGERIADYVRAGGGFLRMDDLASASVRVAQPVRARVGDCEALLASGLNGGPTVAHILGRVELGPTLGDTPDAYWPSFIRAGLVAFEGRLANEGHANRGWVHPTDGTEPDLRQRAGRLPIRPDVKDSTTHLAVVDREGRGVSLTMTLLSRWGSRVIVPGTGVVLNNGVMWCDPRPEAANALRPGATPLANMAPAALVSAGRLRALVGSSGGRRIIAANAQLLHTLAHSRLSAQQAVSAPRVDFTALPVLVSDAVPAERRVALEREVGVPITPVSHRLGTAPFASAVVIAERDGRWETGLDPWGLAAGAAAD